MGDKILWNPSNSVAKAFIDQASSLAGLAKTPTGIGPIVEDESEISPGVLLDFTKSLLATYRSTNNSTLRALSEGVLLIALVLADRAGLQVMDESDNDHQYWSERQAAISRSMPR